MTVVRLCNECAILQGLLPTYDPASNLTGSTYTLGKFLKHTQQQGLPGLVSIFDEPSYQNYQNYAVSGLCSGSYTRYDNGNINVEWIAGRQVGVIYSGLQPVAPADAIVVAWANDVAKIHPIPYNSKVWQTTTCARCGKLILVKNT